MLKMTVAATYAANDATIKTLPIIVFGNVKTVDGSFEDLTTCYSMKEEKLQSKAQGWTEICASVAGRSMN